MGKQKLILLLINIVGGIAVIGSYVLGLRGALGADVLWGGVPESIRPVYIASMGLSAAGYLAILNLILLRMEPEEVTVAGRFGYSIFHPIFCLILGPSVLWMPLTRTYVETPDTGTWTGIRVALFLVGLASVALAVALFTVRPRSRDRAYWAAVVGSCYFVFHTLVLDAILWAALFRT